jgi:hypothetical protein
MIVILAITKLTQKHNTNAICSKTFLLLRVSTYLVAKKWDFFNKTRNYFERLQLPEMRKKN